VNTGGLLRLESVFLPLLSSLSGAGKDLSGSCWALPWPWPGPPRRSPGRAPANVPGAIRIRRSPDRACSKGIVALAPASGTTRPGRPQSSPVRPVRRPWRPTLVLDLRTEASCRPLRCPSQVPARARLLASSEKPPWPTWPKAHPCAHARPGRRPAFPSPRSCPVSVTGTATAGNATALLGLLLS